MYAMLKEKLRGVSIYEWSCETRVKYLVDFIENYYDTRDLMNHRIEKLHNKYKEGTFKVDDAFDSFYDVVTYGSRHFSFYFDCSWLWSERYNTYTRRKVAWALLNKYMYQISKR